MLFVSRKRKLHRGLAYDHCASVKRQFYLLLSNWSSAVNLTTTIVGIVMFILILNKMSPLPNVYIRVRMDILSFVKKVLRHISSSGILASGAKMEDDILV